MNGGVIGFSELSDQSELMTGTARLPTGISRRVAADVPAEGVENYV